MNKYLTKLARLVGKLSDATKSFVRANVKGEGPKSALQKKYHKGLSRNARFDAHEDPANASSHRAKALIERIKSKQD